MVLGTDCHLVIGNQTIRSHHRRRIRTRCGHQSLLQYFRGKRQLSEEAVSQIDWDSHSQAIRTLHITSRPYWSSSSASGFPSASKFAKLMDQAYTNPVLAGIIFDGLHHWFHKTSQSQ
jgi:hypothetical protein